jgi:1,4-dihydroxy-2-naphthoate octaprenyltransferase
MLTITTFFTLNLIWKGHLNLSIGVVMVMIFLLAFFYSIPPVKLSHTGYGELTTAFLVANLIPAFGFMLQTGEIHRLVSLATIPLTFILLPVLLVIQFPDYLTDVKFRKRNLLVRLGWENAMSIHNTFILFSFIILGAVSLFGLPSSISIPAFLPLPLGLLQIWQMRRISAGLKPNWTTLILNAIVLFSLMSYMLAFGFWTR